MKFVFDSFPTLESGEKNCWLLTNGLGGFASTSVGFSVTRADQGLLIAAESPSKRYTLVHRLSERLSAGDDKVFLSSQSFYDGGGEDGFLHLREFTLDDLPEWRYSALGVEVVRRVGMAWEENASAIEYEITNRSDKTCTLAVTPVFQMAPKGEPTQKKLEVNSGDGFVEAAGLRVFVRSNGEIKVKPLKYERLIYPDDLKDGRRESGFGFSCLSAELSVGAGRSGRLWVVFSSEKCEKTGGEIILACKSRRKALIERSRFKSPEARELSRAADSFIAYRKSVGGKTVIAGYPFFGDWGRDTMIALSGLCIATKRFDDAKSILETFIGFERGGLLPNCFPEGSEEPMYNSADAPLLFINCVWAVYRETGDLEFLRRAWQTVKRIIFTYISGTDFAIKMDSDGLISAGKGLDQVTWMDVRIGDVLPTPRHGKPVEINAYWYSDLMAAELMARALGEDGGEYGKLAEKVKKSFNEKFWLKDKGYLRDVLSGTEADEKLRCNQIWALSMPFTMLPEEREKKVLEAVGKHLYTPFGIRTLSPDDPDFHPFYGGSQFSRDMAYHQGTVWPFPAGAFYLAVLRLGGYSREAAKRVRGLLGKIPEILREGCIGQIAEIYDGLNPKESKGCFAQAWSVGEMLTVYRKLEEIEGADESGKRCF